MNKELNNREEKIKYFSKAIKEKTVYDLLEKIEFTSLDVVAIGNLSIERNPFGLTITKSIYVDEQD